MHEVHGGSHGARLVGCNAGEAAGARAKLEAAGESSAQTPLLLLLLPLASRDTSPNPSTRAQVS